MKFVAGADKVTLPKDVSLRAEVGIGKIEGGFGLDVDLFISLPGMDKAAAQQLVEKAHHVCPYSNATRGNIDLRLHVSVKPRWCNEKTAYAGFSHYARLTKRLSRAGNMVKSAASAIIIAAAVSKPK